MARQLAMAIGLVDRDEIHEALYTNQGHPLSKDLVPGDISFSGGIADLIGSTESGDPFRFGDIGVLLGQAIAEDPAFKRVKRHQGTETIGATVVGAGVHTTELSGSTVEFSVSSLPIRNVPIITVPEEAENDPERLPQVIKDLLHALNPDDPTQSVAISLRGRGLNSFVAVQELAGAIIKGASEILEGQHPLVVVLESDRAKVLGQSLAVQRGRREDVICIDSVQTGGGDYIDIGKPVGAGRAVPVVVKTLVFNDRPEGE